MNLKFEHPKTSDLAFSNTLKLITLLLLGRNDDFFNIESTSNQIWVSEEDLLPAKPRDIRSACRI